MGLQEFEHQALALSPAERAHMAHTLLESLDDLQEDEIERLWLDEVIRREAEIDAGLVTLIPAEEVFTRLKEQFRR
jgi:putative addiction module component (TIGR02574 family)